MLRSILVGIDGSAYSASAMELGVRWARQHNATIVCMGIIDEPSIVAPDMVPIGGVGYREDGATEVLSRARNQVRTMLDSFTGQCRAEAVSCKVVQTGGVPHAKIVVEAQRYDLVLLGQKTYFHYATQESPCDTLNSVIRNSPRPVVTAPEKLTEADTVVIAFDGSLQASRALQIFEASGLAAGRDVHVVTVAGDLNEAQQAATRAVDYLQYHGIKAQAHIRETTRAAEAILTYAKQLDAGLIVMGAYGRPTLREFFLGSVTRSVLQDSPVPLFLYH